jgi:hypothetical protein
MKTGGKQSLCSSELANCFIIVSCLAHPSTLKTKAMFPETSAVNGLHGVISQKKELYITTGVRNGKNFERKRLWLN